jgi:methylenetetrahydrofolate dehydrogenase (NADP+)/methenyltetrahydrofolate cyclohydrolase
MILYGKPVADTVLDNIQKSIEHLPIKPHLAVVLVGDNEASQSYIRMKRRACERVGFDFTLIQKDSSITETELIQSIEALNHDSHIHGIIVQSPLPNHMNYQHIIEHIEPKKDVDGFTTYRIGNLFL